MMTEKQAFDRRKSTKWQRILNFVPSWEQLRRISSNHVVQSAYAFLFITPVAAKFVQNLPTQLRLPFNEPDGYQFNIDLPFSWLWLFWSAVGASAANLIFAICCPEIIKKYKDYSEFEKSERGEEELVQLGLNAGAPIKVYRPRTGISGRDIVAARKLDDSHFKKQRISFVQSFNRIYDFANRTRLGFRIASFVGYSIAFLCATWIIGSNIWYVIKFMVSK